MKTFIAALITFALIITLMVINSIYLDHVMNELIINSNSISDFPESGTAPSEQFSVMCHYWEKHKFIISLTVGQKEVDQVDGLIIELISAQKTGDTDAFYKSKSLITEAFTKIRRSERFSFEGVL